MKIGVIGLGKVGLPLALVMRHYGHHQVIGWDIDTRRVAMELASRDPLIHPEKELRGLLDADAYQVPLAPDLESVIRYSDVIFLVPPTPLPGFLGDRPVPNRLETFDLKTLIELYRQVVATAEKLQRKITAVIVSTIGLDWIDKEWLVETPWVQVAYNPPMISLGQVVADFTTQRFLLVGSNTATASDAVVAVWTPVDNKIPALRMSIASAVIAKLAYNAVKTTRITLVNSLAILADAHEAHIDDICGVLHAAGEPRVWAGLGDGGACRIRDLVSLHWGMTGARAGDGLADAILQTREEHADWLANAVGLYCPDDRAIILGTAYKSEVPYEDGSSARLVGGLLASAGVSITYWDPVVHPDAAPPPTRGTFLLAVAHYKILDWIEQNVEAGSTIIDPTGITGEPATPTHLRGVLQGRGVQIVRPGRHQ